MRRRRVYGSLTGEADLLAMVRSVTGYARFVAPCASFAPGGPDAVAGEVPVYGYKAELSALAMTRRMAAPVRAY